MQFPNFEIQDTLMNLLIEKQCIKIKKILILFSDLLNTGVSPKCSSTMGMPQGSQDLDVNETNMQLEPVGFPVSNTSCIGEVPDTIGSLDENKTQVSAKSLAVARSPSETKLSLFEVGLLRKGLFKALEWLHTKGFPFSQLTYCFRFYLRRVFFTDVL